jgi:hypothetical protein
MCEFSEKLIAYLDRELSEEDSVIVEQHGRRCAECRREVEIYRTLNEMIDTFCEAAILAVPKKRQRATPRVGRAVLLGTAAVAAAVLLVVLAMPVRRFLWMDSPVANTVPPTTLHSAPIPSLALEKTPVVQTATAQTPRPTRKPRLSRQAGVVSTSRKRNESLWPDQAPVYVAIPADALFPPGALPEGVGFVADVNLRPDGSAQRLRLQPQLVGFQRRGAQP